jgi:hypothetical protein
MPERTLAVLRLAERAGVTVVVDDERQILEVRKAGAVTRFDLAAVNWDWAPRPGRRRNQYVVQVGAYQLVLYPQNALWHPQLLLSHLSGTTILNLLIDQARAALPMILWDDAPAVTFIDVVED